MYDITSDIMTTNNKNRVQLIRHLEHLAKEHLSLMESFKALQLVNEEQAQRIKAQNAKIAELEIALGQ